MAKQKGKGITELPNYYLRAIMPRIQWFVQSQIQLWEARMKEVSVTTFEATYHICPKEYNTEFVFEFGKWSKDYDYTATMTFRNLIRKDDGEDEEGDTDAWGAELPYADMELGWKDGEFGKALLEINDFYEHWEIEKRLK